MTEFQEYIQRYLDLIPSENWLEEMINSGAETIQIFFWFRQRKITFCLCRRKMDAQGIASSFNRYRKDFPIQSASFCQKRPNRIVWF